MTAFRIAAFVLFLPAFTYAQPLTGIVTDAQSGERLPAATIIIVDTNRGTIANAEGEFTITPPSYPVTLQIRFIGFESKTLTIDSAPDEPLQIEMEPAVFELGEIVVTDRDPGLSIMERVIERKKIWRADLENYRAEAYTRQVLSNDRGIVSITESGTHSYWDRERGFREVQLFKEQTSNVAPDENFAGVSFFPNLYNDDIPIAGFDLVGVTHPDALRFYDFKLLDTTQMDGRPVYHIAVEPNRNLQPLFEGSVWVLGGDYALLEVDLKPNRVVRFPAPVQEFNLTYQQQFRNFDGLYWLPVDMRIEGTVRVGMPGLRFPDFLFSQTSQVADYEVNTTLPDSLYQEDRLLHRVDDLDERFELRQVERIPLTQDEEIAYTRIDSTQTLEEAFRPEGFLARFLDDNDGDTRPGRSTPVLNAISPSVGFNRVDGFKAGATYEQVIRPLQTRFNGQFLYNFRTDDTDLTLSSSTRLFTFGRRSSLHLLGRYANATTSTYTSAFYTPIMNSVNAVLGGRDYFDYYRRERMAAGLDIRRILPRTSVSVLFSREHHSSFAENSAWNYSLFGWHPQRRDNPLIDDGTLHAFSVDLRYNVQPENYGVSGNRQARLAVETSSDAFGSDFDYTTLRLDASWNWQTFFKRRFFANTLDVRFSGALGLGDQPVQRLFAVDGSKSLFSPFGTLKTRTNVPYVGRSMWAATAEHNFRSVPFELLGLQALAEREWGIILFAGAGETDAVQREDLRIRGSDGIHSEAGFSINGIFTIIRLDVAFRLDEPSTFIGFSATRFF
ncbi:MAG: DUF5686 family protein [Balneolaceae bacterium]